MLSKMSPISIIMDGTTYTGEMHDTGEIWLKSQCLQHEDRTNRRIFEALSKLGYTEVDFRKWKKDNKTVVVCLVDDIRSCSTDYEVDMPYLFDANTTVITDNQVLCPTVFKVINLPKSFYGIYSYKYGSNSWDPTRDFSFSINRTDFRRFFLMLDLTWRVGLDRGHVNFNGVYRGSTQLSPLEACQLFWKDIGDQQQKHFERPYELITNNLPFKNYTIHFDEIFSRSWINLNVETYSSDDVVSISEKVFRCLVVPAPWTVYSGRYTVAYLESLGFDCMGDMIDHNHYDKLKEAENKISIYNWHSLEQLPRLKEQRIDYVRQRCLDASKHNQKILAEMRNNFSKDFDSWIDDLSNQL